jgi:formylglycine-generating enzyme required for sulfatase activity
VSRAAVALVRLGSASDVWHLLEYQPDPRYRSAFVDALSTFAIDPLILSKELARLRADRAPSGGRANSSFGGKNGYLFDRITSRCRAIVMVLARCSIASTTGVDRESIVQSLRELYHNDPDAGLHSAAELALKHWEEEPRPNAEEKHVPESGDPHARRWYVNPEGQTLVLIDRPGAFDMGAPPWDPEREDEEVWHRREIPRRFFILTKEVSVSEFQKYSLDILKTAPSFNKRYTDIYSSMIGLSWFEAAAYCNWLSDREGLPQCYVPNKDGKFAEGMTVDVNAVIKGGYRLPSEAEWEYACRAGSVTSRYYGHSLKLLGAYERYNQFSGFRAHPGGTLLPNDLGLFDMMGNVAEWCEDVNDSSQNDEHSTGVDRIAGESISTSDRFFRGGSWRSDPAILRSTTRGWFGPSSPASNIGLRPARTCP